jgi:hypothetical protein
MMAIKKFAFVADNDVFTVWTFDTEGQEDINKVERIIAGLQSDPKIIEILDTTINVGLNWTFDGTNFIPPTA